MAKISSVAEVAVNKKMFRRNHSEMLHLMNLIKSMKNIFTSNFTTE